MTSEFLIVMELAMLPALANFAGGGLAKIFRDWGWSVVPGLLSVTVNAAFHAVGAPQRHALGRRLPPPGERASA